MPPTFNSISRAPISAVPTNIITGFLGAGKTSAILHLLSNKPEHERWAVLVNEFGEVGIDGSIIEARYSEQSGVYVREVPGGCMCCAAGVPMRVALTQLIRQAMPDRLLIEPTGLGHPKEVLQTLNDSSFQGVISMQSIITLVDARQFSDSRYVEHETFQQQIGIADVLVANKQDLYTAGDELALENYLNENALSDLPMIVTEQGVIDISLLDGSKAMVDEQRFNDSRHIDLTPTLEQPNLNFAAEIPECGYTKAVNQGEGFFSAGWRFSNQFEFDRNSVFALLSGVSAERLKATIITNDGCFAYNFSRDAMSEVAIEQVDESRIEMIGREPNDELQTSLFNCLSRGERLS